MAYGSRPRRRTRRSFARRRPITRRVRRTTYRRRSFRPRRMMSRRRILNVASVKKQDNMIPIVADPNGTNPSPNPYTVTGIQQLFSVWCATARDKENDFNVSSRNSSTCYMRGLKERITFSANSGRSWRWRRICFTAKGLFNSLGTSVDNLEMTPNGWVRLITNQNVTPWGGAVKNVIFRGLQTLDWNDIFDAKVDSSRVTIKYDKTRILNSGNDFGKFSHFNMWHAMNKNLVYGDDEQGNQDLDPTYSTFGKAGMGDFYVVDILQAGSGATASDTLAFNPQATLYWHEK